MTTSHAKNKDIEVLRGVAIIITIYAHLRLLFPWSPAWFESSLAYFSPSVGVDLFFCISGYVITSSIIRGSDAEGRFKNFAFPFWIRRMWRLWPSAWVWVVLNIICAYFLNWYGTFGQPINTVYSSISAVFHVANFYFPYCVSNQTCGANMVNWSLSLEEQFYFIFPFVFYYFSKGSLSRALIALVLLQFFLHRPAATILWSIRTDAICSGVLLALHKDKIVNIVEKLLFFISERSFLILIASLISIAMIPATKVGAISGMTTLVCFIFTAIAASNVSLAPQGIIQSIFIYIGSRSYAIYLSHEVVFRLINEIYMKLNGSRYFGEDNTFLFSLVGIILVLAVAEANYKLVENPLRKIGRNLAVKYA